MDFKKEKERLRNMNYAQFKEFIVGLARKDAMHHGEDFAVFYHGVRQMSVIVKNSPDDKNTHFAAFETAERGVVLAIFRVKFTDKDDKGFMSIEPSFIENPVSYRCPRKVLEVLTDPQAEKYKSLVDAKYPLDEENRLLDAARENLFNGKPNVVITEEEKEILAELS